MILKTSLFDKGLILSDVKRFWWASALYTLLLFFILPLKHIMLKNAMHEEWIRNQVVDSLIMNVHQSEFQIILMLVMPVILAVLVFRYMQKNNAASMMHSLPYTRKTLYCSHSAAGFVLLALPIILNGLVLMILQGTTNLGEYYSFLDIVGWGGQTLILNILFFSVTIFAGMFTGSSIAQMVFSYIVQILPAGVYILFKHNIGQLIHGYSSAGRLRDPILDRLPIFVLLNNRAGVRYISTWSVISYLLIAIALFIIGYYVYKLRNLEASGDVVAFIAIRPVFKFGVTVCSMLLGGIYFTSIARGSFPTLIFGYVLSSFLGYWIAEILMEKSFKVLGAYKGYVAYTVIMLVVLMGVQTDVTGYVGRIPEAEEVEKVYLGYNGDVWMDIESEVQKTRDSSDVMDFSGKLFESEANIENMIAFHEELVKEPTNKIGRYQYIVYGLKNGQYLKRYYAIDEQRYADQLRPIYESLEYKQTRFPVIEQRESDIKWIEITDERIQKKSAMLIDSAEIHGFIKALQMDIENATYEDLVMDRGRSVRAIIMDQNERIIEYAIRNQNKFVEQWLKDQGYYEEVILMPEDVEYIVLDKVNSSDSRKRVEVRDKAVIEELVKVSAEFGYDHTKENVSVAFYMTGFSRHPEYMYIQANDSNSEKLKAYINQLNE
ncbi:hypothetical protein Amet_1325 [Alkaliphilus metalliredigens QYMF]|uniref:DUF6449 domain-containing protein n=1 Tax=Alkaliphilus metalliredigens (strain QYMF) TaxID=293826 RepID=A6TMV9_ALKMQ|nr:DUF6449 domain-containing protein [Alkaliphilus metalliredigens]ABR47527.1 hypothetical protein Amet_1325 [Alkaliphilus metalliredigens QYMF]